MARRDLFFRGMTIAENPSLFGLRGVTYSYACERRGSRTRCRCPSGCGRSGDRNDGLWRGRYGGERSVKGNETLSTP